MMAAAFAEWQSIEQGKRSGLRFHRRPHWRRQKPEFHQLHKENDT
jgi:hypothetical protein